MAERTRTGARAERPAEPTDAASTASHEDGRSDAVASRGRVRGDERRRAIIDAARRRAAEGGWVSVTTRRLSEDIGFTQPVLYAHFPGGKADIVRAVALDGFADLASRLHTAGDGRHGRAAVLAVAETYLAFAREQQTVYEAMFSLPIAAEFGSARSEPEMLDAFAGLVAVFGPSCDDVETVTEVFWSALHGVGTLEASARLRPYARDARIAEIADRFA